MKPALIDIIRDYQELAAKAVYIFRTKYQIDDILEGWHSGIYQQTGKLTEEGINFYAFHGIGLAVHFEDKIVDFDLAYFPEQRHDGFNLSRLISFIKNSVEKYSEYKNNEKVEKEFNELISNGIIENPKLEDSTFLYFFKDTLK